jgi:hypothetical protein
LHSTALLEIISVRVSEKARSGKIPIPHRFFNIRFWKEKPPLQSKFTLLPSKFFPAKIPFSKIQKKNLAGKKLLFKIVNFTFQRKEV